MEIPPNEVERLAALVSYGILDTAFEDSFDRITRLSAHMFSAPVSLVSLIDTHRQWFKSVHGQLAVRETARDVAFCAHTILGDDVMVVPNATQDPRFRDNPLVTGDAHVRFYAGAPLITADGYALGSICVVDSESRAPLAPHEAQMLKDLAGIVVDLLEARRMATELKQLRSR
jgi:GAF domain-containing protein